MQLNPERGFVSSANQRPTDSTYPYYLGRGYPPYRGFIINRKLNGMNSVTPQDMMDMQTNNDNIFAEMAMPVILKNVKEDLLNADEKKYLDILEKWNLKNDPGERGTTIFELVWKAFYDTVWSDEFENAPKIIMLPYESTLLEGVLRDSAYKFLDNIKTPGVESLADDMTAAFKKALIDIKKADEQGYLAWAKFKDTRINHLAKLEPLGRMHIPIGGGRYCINATKSQHGPSWRMVVSLTPETQAYGVYPGGQSGNPGSRFYDSFIDTWAAGKYYDLWIMKNNDQKNKRVVWKLTFNSI
jgi:penicillin amidase